MFTLQNLTERELPGEVIMLSQGIVMQKILANAMRSFSSPKIVLYFAGTGAGFYFSFFVIKNFAQIKKIYKNFFSRNSKSNDDNNDRNGIFDNLTATIDEAERLRQSVAVLGMRVANAIEQKKQKKLFLEENGVQRSELYVHTRVDRESPEDKHPNDSSSSAAEMQIKPKFATEEDLLRYQQETLIFAYQCTNRILNEIAPIRIVPGAQ